MGYFINLNFRITKLFDHILYYIIDTYVSVLMFFAVVRSRRNVLFTSKIKISARKILIDQLSKLISLYLPCNALKAKEKFLN